MDVIESKSLVGMRAKPVSTFPHPALDHDRFREIAHRLDLFVLPHVPRLRRLGLRHFRSHNHHQTTLYYAAV